VPLKEVKCWCTFDSVVMTHTRANCSLLRLLLFVNKLLSLLTTIELIWFQDMQNLVKCVKQGCILMDLTNLFIYFEARSCGCEEGKSMVWWRYG
jgi:hypothetical protein